MQYDKGMDSPTIYTRSDRLGVGRTSFLDPDTPGYNDTDWKTMQLQNGDAALFSSSETRQSQTSRSDSFQNGDSLHRHLLVETAMFDSSSFDVLSIEEVESLKKEKTAVEARIEGTRRKLALESKVRDAAKSLHRLYSQKGRKSVTSEARLSLDSNNRDSVNQAGDDLAVSETKVQELVQILVGLENRRQYVESRLLRHTAAVLQAAHLEREADHAHHLNPDSLPYIRDFDQSVHDDFPKESLIDDAQLADVNTRLELLNGQMRSLISQAKKGSRSRDHSPDETPSAYPEDGDAATRMNSQLQHLQEHVFSLVQEHKRMSQSHQDLTNDSKHEQHVIEGRLGGVNSQLFSLISNSSDRENIPELQPPPQVSGHGTQEQINYLEESLFNVEQMVNRSEQHQESHSTVMNLWGLLASNKPAQSNRDVDSDSEEPEKPMSEPFSLQAFNTKVQHMLTRSNNHESQIDTLRRQIEQQRDLAGKADADATEMQALKEREQETLEELESHRKRVEALEDQIVVLENGITEHQDEARIAGIELEHKESEHKELTESIASANTAKEAAEVELAKKEEEMLDLESEVVRLTTELTMAKAELDGAYGSRSERARELASHPEFQDLEKKHRALIARMEHLHQEKNTYEEEMQKTTALYKEAEERALALEGEIMTIREIQATSTQGDGRMKMLEKELADMATDYQELTRETVEMEKERAQLESIADGLRDKMEALEQQLSDERVRWLGVRSPSGTPDMGARETTSTMVLRNEFKKMMRETRAEGVKLLRSEQEQRRQVEAQLRAMRRERNGGASPRVALPSPGLRPM